MAATSLKRPLSLRYVVYSILWMGFLLLQITIFTPLQESPQNAFPPQDDVSTTQSTSWRASRKVPYFQKQRQQRQLATAASTSSATFNHIDVTYRENRGHLQSTTDCIGRDLVKDDPMGRHANYTWMFRSCQYRQLCLNTETHEFVTVMGDNNINNNPSMPEQELAMGSINPRWSGRGFNKGYHKVKWAPRPVTSETIPGYYELPPNVVLVPFHSMAAHNVGHLLWDDLYPLYTLLTMFGYTPNHDDDNNNNNNRQYLVLRWTAQGKLYATCEMQKKKVKICNDNLQRFLPLLGVDPETFSTVKQAQLQANPGTEPLKSTYVCSKQAVAGIGMLMDHGFRDHGWMLRDPASGLDLVPHNLGRGGIFHDFRNFLLENMGLSSALPPPTVRNKITFSTYSSGGFERSLGFENQIAIVNQVLMEHHHPQQKIQVQSITMKDLSLEEQMRVATESAIFVTVSGGGAVTATFLPPGSTLIVYYLEDGGFDFWNYSYTYTPARLDWDLLGNAAHLQVHWLPIKSMESKEDLNVLKHLVMHDLETTNLL